MKTIYCDEAGFTGNRLWDNQQPYFSYASIEIEPDEARDYVESLRRSLRVDASELKGGALCRKPRGQAVVQRVLADHASRAQVILFDKRYSLAGKMFEYLFEPVLAPMSSLLYDIGFHKFVANGLYAQLCAGEGAADRAFLLFQDALRSRRHETLQAIDTAINTISPDNFSDKVITFLICNRGKIADEVVEDFPTTAGRWMLELTITALRTLLATYGSDMEPLSVFCDDSKPLAEQVEFFNVMVGRTDRQTISFDGHEHQITFNLASPIQLVSSASSPGVQLADVFASASAFAYKNPDHDLSKAWSSHSEAFVHECSVFPEPDCFDLQDPKTIVNCIVFQQLIDQAVRGENYFTHLPRLIQDAQEWVEANHQTCIESAT